MTYDMSGDMPGKESAEIPGRSKVEKTRKQGLGRENRVAGSP